MTTPSPIWEGHYVRHAADGFVGVHVGFTRLAHLIQRPGELRAVRVELPGGEVKVVSERSLERADLADYDKYAGSIGVEVKRRSSRALAGRA
jgi:hypothetical protein